VPNAVRLIELFHEAKARPAGAERARFLAAACPGEPELQDQVTALLQAHEGAGNFLENPQVFSRTAAVSEVPGDKLGHYQLLQPLGEGGCGVVYLAEQEEPVRRKVALKVIKLGMDTRQVIARFEAERQALALMDHPNIAKVFDAGATELGRPYFVMELVRGIKITDYCEQHGLTTAERLNLFIQVCQAVQHAHQKGIIHRDLKPSNILVAQHDTIAVPKIIDFGIAKATSEQRLTDKTMFTAYEQFMGTPAYMSPEQAQLNGLDIDTRTDLYSLGVLLYELLTGSTPFDTQALLKGGFDEMRRVVREAEPEKPSTRLMQVRTARPHAGFRQSRIQNPKIKIDRDLDWIVMKCLEKDRARRYETANDLAADIKSHLGQKPVLARPPSQLDRCQKLVRRNKPAFVAASVIAIALLAGFFGVLWQSVARQKALTETRRLLYATDMNLAQQAVEALNFGRAMELLERHRPERGVPAEAGSGPAHPSHRQPKRQTDKPDLRGFEWRYLWGLCRGDEQETLRGHTDTVTCVAFSPDGGLLASSSKDKTVRLWNTASPGSCRVLSEYPGEIYSVAFSEDGRQLVAAGHRGVTLWDTQSWTAQRNLPGRFRSAVFTRDLQTIVAANKAGVTVLATARMRGSFALPDTSGPAVLSRDERQLATLSRAGIKLWDVSKLSSNAAPRRTIAWTQFEHSGEHELAFSPDGGIVAAGDSDGHVILFDPVSGRDLATFQQSGRIDTLVFSPDGKALASASADQTVRLWDVVGRTNLVTLQGHRNAVWSVAFSSDGQTLATGSADRTVKLWKEVSRRSTYDIHLAGPDSWISNDGTTLANRNHSRVQFLDVSTKQVRASFTLPARSEYWNVSRGGHRMAVVSNGWVHVWNVPSKTEGIAFKIPLELQIPSELAMGPLQISPSGGALAINGPGSTVLWWSLPSGREQRSFSGTLVELLDDVVVTQGLDGTVTFWDCKTGRETLALRGHEGLVKEVSFSPDGKTVATASWDHTARLWEARTGHEIGVLRGHKEGLDCIDFSPDGRTLATGSADDTIKLWNVATRQEVLTLRPRHGDILHLRFVPDGSALITLTITGQGQVWPAPALEVTDAPDTR
jgi:WD40 repeat protein/serine/threonine protein kinase